MGDPYATLATGSFRALKSGPESVPPTRFAVTQFRATITNPLVMAEDRTILSVRAGRRT
jgi:hypothetical protein